MSIHKCSSCGQAVEAAPRCPRCGAEQPPDIDEISRIERSIAEMKAREAAIAKEQKQIAAKMQAAVFQRDILSHAGEKRRKQPLRTRRVLLRRPDRRPPTVASGTAPPRVPRQPHGTGADRSPPAPPSAGPADGAPPGADPGGHPEASSREVQNILLGLGALLLGVAAVVFAAVAISSFDDIGRVSILIAATVLTLAAAPVVARRGLTSTAETIAAVGLLLVALDGYAVWTVDRVWQSGLSPTVFAGTTLLVTAVIAAGYSVATGLNAPRYATLLALQPVLPLLTHHWLTGPAGWALVLSAVAVMDLLLSWVVSDEVRLALGSPGPDRYRQVVPPPDGPDGPERPPVERPETSPEEADVALGSAPSGRTNADPRRPGPDSPRGTRPATVDRPPAAARRATPWLPELSWCLHILAVTAALVCAVSALTGAGTLSAAARTGGVLLLAAALGVAGALLLNRQPVTDLAAGVMTLAVIGAAGRFAAVALPGRALLLISAVIAVTGFGVRALPGTVRRGPQLASAAALVVIGVVVAAGALRAALAPVRAALPVWEADLTAHSDTLAKAVGPAGWQLAASAFLLAVAAVVALPAETRREFGVVGVALTALSLPASFGLPWALAPWPPVLAAIGIGLAGLTADTRRGALTHVGAATVLGMAGAGAALARPGLTAAVLFTLAAGGTLTALTPTVRTARPGRMAPLVADWAAGGAAFALPGAVAVFVASTVPVDPTPTAASVRAATEPVLAASFLAACGTVCYAAVALVARRGISTPLTIGTGLGALAVTAATFGAPGAVLADAWVGGLLLVAAVLLLLAPSIDAGRRADRLLDGADFAAAAATAALIGALARIAGVLTDGAELAAAAFLVLVVATGIRAMPGSWRRGPVLGIACGGGLIAVIAGWTALSGGLRALATPGRLWEADLDRWHTVADGGAWQAPVALVLLAGVAAIALPRPWAWNVAGACVVLATIGTPAALGLPWWSPIVVGGTVAAAYGIASVAAADPGAGLARVTVAAAVALHAIGASLVRPWTTAAALGMVTLVGLTIAVLARLVGVVNDEDPTPELLPHLGQIGGLATGAAVLAFPGAIAALAAELGWPAGIVLTGALAASSLAVGLLVLAGPRIPPYLPYGTVGIAGGATVTALASLFAPLPWGLFAAAAVLLGVLAELARAGVPPPGSGREGVRRWSVMLGGAVRRLPEPPTDRWSVSPAAGAMAAAAVPTVVAVAAVAPALVTALVEPYRTVTRIWAGPPPELTGPPGGTVDGGNALAAFLLTVAAALAATGFSGGRPARAVPVVLPGVAVTFLIVPISLGVGWPGSTVAALAVFTIAMLGLALAAPPPDAERARSLRLARLLVFGIGLAAGGAGLAGALATRELTVLTLGGAVLVGTVAALAGRTQYARILGWLFASIMAQLLVFTVGLVAGLAPVWSAFGVLAVGAILLLVAATLPRLRRPEAAREATTVEWSGYAAALIAAALAYDSPRHIAALLAAWGAVLGVSATRPGRSPIERRTLFWAAVACEISAWWLLMSGAGVVLPEAYTLPFAALALLVGYLESRHRDDLSSWVAYGPALVATFLPTLVIVLGGADDPVRQVLLLLGGVATLIFGSVRRQQAPVITGAVITAVAALHALFSFGPWLVLIPVGLVLLALGASNENRRRTQERLRVVRGMR